MSRSFGAVDDPSVACVFCREPIEISTFRPAGHLTRTSSCSNCGLLVSVAEQVWALWNRASPTADVDRRLAERLRARRVATGARAILDRVAQSPDLADEPSKDHDAAGAHPDGLTPRSRTAMDTVPVSSSAPGRRHYC